MKKGELNHNWKGDKVGYFALHRWVERQKGRPNKCDHCQSENEKKYHWANKSHEYKRDLDDWIRLCYKCHIKFDIHLFQRGVDRWNTKVNPEKVKLMRMLYFDFNWKQIKIMKLFSLSQSHTSQIIRKNKWKYI